MLRLVDDLFFVLECQRPMAAVGPIDHQMVLTSHNAWEKKPLNALRFEFTGQFHEAVRSASLRHANLTASPAWDDPRAERSKSTLQAYNHGVDNAWILVGADLSGSAYLLRRSVGRFLKCLGGVGLKRSRTAAASATCSLKILCDTSSGGRAVMAGCVQIAPYTPKSRHIYGANLYYMARSTCNWRDSML